MSAPVVIARIAPADAIPDGIKAVALLATRGYGSAMQGYIKTADAAEQAGLVVLPRHALDHGAIDRQVDFFIRSADLPRGPGRAVVDFEDPRCDLRDLRQFIQAMRNWNADLRLIVFSTDLLLLHLGHQHDPVLHRSDLWLGKLFGDDEDETPEWPDRTWFQWTLRQHASAGAIFNGDDAAFEAWLDRARGLVDVAY